MFVKVTAVVVKYEPDALRDTFEDGAFAVYDATELRIVSPEKYVGKLVVFHNQPPDDKSPWKAIGATIGFRLKADLLESKDTQVFSGAMEAIQMIKKPGEGRRVRRQPPTAAALQRREAPSAVGRERATREPKTS